MSNEADFAPKPGDLVMLRSGGPALTVVETSSIKSYRLTVTCRWFRNGRAKTHDFSANELKPFERPKRIAPPRLPPPPRGSVADERRPREGDGGQL